MTQAPKHINTSTTMVKVLSATAIVSMLISCQATAVLPQLQQIEQKQPITPPAHNQINIQTGTQYPKLEDPVTVTTQNSEQGIHTNLNAFVVRTTQTAEKSETINVPLLSTSVQSGDVILYQVTISNHSADRVGSVNIDLNIPRNVRFLGFDNALPQPNFASADGIKFLHAPIIATVNGVRQPLPLPHYRGLRWVIENLASGENTSVQFQAQVK